jgi:hypothetical protein
MIIVIYDIDTYMIVNCLFMITYMIVNCLHMIECYDQRFHAFTSHVYFTSIHTLILSLDKC